MPDDPDKRQLKQWLAVGILLDSKKTGQPNPLGPAGDLFWRMGTVLGFVLILVCVACLAASWSKTPTVVIAGDFDMLTLPTVLAMLVLAMIVGISWARLSASSLTGLFFSSLVLGFGALSLMLVPGLLTGSQFAEYRAFSGPSTKVRQDFRIWWAYEHSGKRVWDYAVINPYHIEHDRTGILPEIPITKEAFQLIRTANPEAPVDSPTIFYNPNKLVKSTNLCMNFIAQRAGAYERLLLSTKADIPVQVIHPCARWAR